MVSWFRVVAIVGMICIILVGAVPLYEDSEGEATGNEHNGRVQIKVYRGPTEHGHPDDFAPWGYWVKQPAEDYSDHY